MNTDIFHTRLEKMNLFMAANNLKAMIIAGSAHNDDALRYISGPSFQLVAAPAFVLVCPNAEPILYFSDPARPNQLTEYRQELDDHWIQNANPKDLNLLCRDLINANIKEGRIGINLDMASASITECLRKVFDKINLVDITEAFLALRRDSDELSVELAEQGTRLVESAFEELCGQLHIGCNVVDLITRLDYIMKRDGAEETFNGGGLARRPVFREKPGTVVLAEAGDFLAIEVSVRYCGVWSQRLMCASFGQPNPDFLRLFDASCKASRLAAAEARPGCSSKHLIDIMNDSIHADGFLSFYDFEGLPPGHFMGAQMDSGTFTRESDFTLNENMIFVLHASVKDPVSGLLLRNAPGSIFHITDSGCQAFGSGKTAIRIIEN